MQQHQCHIKAIIILIGIYIVFLRHLTYNTLFIRMTFTLVVAGFVFRHMFLGQNYRSVGANLTLRTPSNHHPKYSYNAFT